MWEWLPKQVDSYYRESHDTTFDSKKQFQPIKSLIRLGQPRVSTPGILLWRTTGENDLQCHLQHLAGNGLPGIPLVTNIRFCDIDYGMNQDLYKLSELCNNSLGSQELFVWLVNKCAIENEQSWNGAMDIFFPFPSDGKINETIFCTQMQMYFMHFKRCYFRGWSFQPVKNLLAIIQK